MPNSVVLREITLLAVFVGMALTCGGILIFDEINHVPPDSTVLSILTFILGVLARDFGSTGTQTAVSEAATSVAQATLRGVQAGQNGGGTHE